MGPVTSPPNERFPALDGLRGIAAVGVVLFHVYPKYTFWCWSFVDLFFVLSGFLITRILITSPLPTGLMLKRFWARRILRIWPVYYLALFVCLAYGLAKMLKVDPGYQMHDVWQTFLFLQFVEFHFVPYSPQWDYIPYFKHTWSLAVEEQFYIIWPLILLCLRNHLRWTLPIALGLMTLSLTLRSNGVFDLALGTRCDGLALGSLIAIAYQFPQFRWWRFVLIPLLAWAVLVIAHYGYDGYVIFPDYPMFDIDSRSSTVTVPAFAVVYAALIVYCLARPESRLCRTLAAPTLVSFGSISSALYVFHAPVTGFFKGVAILSNGGAFTWWMDAMVLPLSIGAAHLSKITVERYFDRFKHHFPMHRA